MTTPLAAPRFRDRLNEILPVWMQDRTAPGFAPSTPNPRNVLYRIVWVLAAVLDALLDFVMQGIQAAWPGVGTPTALPYIGRSRGLVQGITETNDHFAGRLVTWLEAHSTDLALAVAQQLHEYIGDNPAVRVIERRNGVRQWTTVAKDGSVSYSNAAWDWDSISDPGNTTHVSDMWIVVYTDVPFWPARPGTLGGIATPDDGNGLGLYGARMYFDQVRNIIANWKGAHARVVAVLFCSLASAYDPNNPSSLMPNGTWGHWTSISGGNSVPSGRDLVYTRYMEPN